MKGRTSFLFKNMGILTISNFASKILIFLLVPLYTSVLSIEEYGTYDLVISTVSLMFPILTANVVDAVMRFLMEKSYSNKKVAVIGIRYIIVSIVIVIIFLIVINRLGLWRDITGLEIYMGLYYISYVLNQFFIQFSKGLERVTDMGIAGVLSTIVMLGGNILFLLVLGWGLQGFFIANILTQAIAAVYFFIRLRFWEYIGERNIDKVLQKEMLKYCVPLITTTLAWWINTTADKYAVRYFCGISANGILAVSYKIPQILNTLQGIFIQAWQISAIKEYGEKDTDIFYGEIFSVINIFMAGACAWLIILSKPLAALLYAKDFYIAWKYVPFLLISSMLNCASGLLGPILSAQKDSKSMAIAAMYGASFNIVINIVLVFLIGIQGATITTAISSFIIYAVRKKKVGKSIKVEGYWEIVITWILLCIQAIVNIYVQIWYVEAALMVLMLWVNRINILKLYSKKTNRKYI